MRWWLLGLWLAAAGLGTAWAAAPTSLDGQWRYLPLEGPADMSGPQVDDHAWQPMTLPSNWFLKGQKQYPTANDLSPAAQAHVGNPGELGSPQLDRGLEYSGTVWFRRHFQATAGRSVLHFDSVDYFATVYVNGHEVGRHEGYFEPFEFDVSRYVKPGDNLIAVRVDSPALIFDWSETYPQSWPKHQAFIKGIFGYHDTRPGGTTVRGQERGTGGIIGSVSLRHPADVEVLAANVTPQHVSTESADVHIDYTIRNWTSKPLLFKVDQVVQPANFPGTVILRSAIFNWHVPPGQSHFTSDIKVSHPSLWWSWDYGRPNLYELQANDYKTRFGIRSIRHDDKWVWFLNDVRIFPRGTNYISTQWLSQTDKAWYTRDVKLMTDCNLNSVRVHAHVEKPEFYAACDEAGLMVWQDFPLQWGYSDNAVFQREACRQVHAMIDRDFNHPSIIVWCLHNESPYAMSWMEKKDAQQNLALDNALLAEANKDDHSRVNHRDSGTGDGHIYDGWYGSTVSDYKTDKMAPFLTEYGAEAIPDLDTLKTMFPADMLWPQTQDAWDVWGYHNFQYDQTFNVAKVPRGDSIEQLIDNSQNYQAALLKFTTELFRRRKWNDMTGIYEFMFVDDWPSITWSVVDYYRHPKKGYYRLQTAMQPVLPSIDYDIQNPEGPLTLWVVNDHPEAYPKATLQWSMGGESHTVTVDVPADSSIKVQEVGTGQAIASGATSLKVQLTAADGHVLGQNLLEKSDYVLWKQ